jgi:serine/threonine protein kinase
MFRPVVFLHCLGKALCRKGLRALVGAVPFGDQLYEIAEATWEELRQRREEETLAALAETAALSPVDAAAAAGDVVRQVAADQPEQVQQNLRDYLAQVPVAVRQPLRRPADPSGKTVPNTLTLRRAEDLLPFLPVCLPRFHSGDTVPGRGDWKLVELLGVGGFAEVWKGINAHTGETAAFKFCVAHEAATALRQSAETLRNEAKLLARLRSEGKDRGFVRLMDTNLDGDTPFLVYEYVAGGNLSGLIRDWQARGGADPEEATAKLCAIAEIVAVAHSLHPPIVHRDLKPANILVERGSDGQPDLKVADFGIGGMAASRDIARTRGGAYSQVMTEASAWRGAYSLLYASPQQMRGGKADPRDDVHALGVIWWQMLTGDLNASRPSGSGWKKRLEERGMSRERIELLERCIEEETTDRLPDAGALAAALRPRPEAVASDTSARQVNGDSRRGVGTRPLVLPGIVGVIHLGICILIGLLLLKARNVGSNYVADWMSLFLFVNLVLHILAAVGSLSRQRWGASISLVAMGFWGLPLYVPIMLYSDDAMVKMVALLAFQFLVALPSLLFFRYRKLL